MSKPKLRRLRAGEFDALAELICASTNAWYMKHRGFEAFPAGPRSCRLFPEVYESLDPGCCVVAEDPQSKRLMGSCFYHPRPRHISLGIMNVHPDFFGRHVASSLLKFVTDIADRADKPLRLVSSAMNLDSFSLYSRAGFVPRAAYADMQVAVPASGIRFDGESEDFIQPAGVADVQAIARLEKSLCGIERVKDYEFFIDNRQGVWTALTHYDQAGRVNGFLCSIDHPACNMIGPGFMRSDEVAIRLIAAQLNLCAGRSPILLIPLDRPRLVKQMYAWGAKNVELHFAQSRGPCPSPRGVVMPTFMPETG